MKKKKLKFWLIVVCILFVHLIADGATIYDVIVQTDATKKHQKPAAVDETGRIAGSLQVIQNLRTDGDSVDFNSALDVSGTATFADTVNIAGNLEAVTGRSATFFIAASNATALEIAQAHYVCDGTDDDVQMNAAHDALITDESPAAVGKIELSSGDFHLGGSIYMKGEVTFTGAGLGATSITMANSTDTDMFSFAPGLGGTSDTFFYTIENMTINGTSANMASGMGVNTTGDEAGSDMWDFHMRHVFVNDFKDTGVYIDMIWGTVLDDVIIEYGSSDGLVLNSNTDAKITDCKIIQNDGRAIVVNADAYSVKIQGCYLSTNDTTNAPATVDIFGNNTVLIGNTIAVADTGTDNIGVRVYGNKTVIVGNTFGGNGINDNADTSDTAIFITYDGTDTGANTTIVGNFIDISTWSSVYGDETGATGGSNVYFGNSPTSAYFVQIGDKLEFTTYGERIYNTTDGRIEFVGTGGANNQSVYFDLDETTLTFYTSAKTKLTQNWWWGDELLLWFGEGKDFGAGYNATNDQWQLVDGSVLNTGVIIRADGDTVSIEDPIYFKDPAYFVQPAYFQTTMYPQSIIVNDIVGQPVNVSDSMVVGDGGITDYALFEEDGDLTFHGTGGLAFGEIYTSDNSTATVLDDIDTWVQCVVFDTDGDSNNAVGDHTNDHITITTAGMYMVNVSASVATVGGSACEAEFEVKKNNGVTDLPNIHTDRDLDGGGGDHGSISMSGIADCAASDTLEVWVRNKDNTTPVVFEDITLTIFQLGGT